MDARASMISAALKIPVALFVTAITTGSAYFGYKSLSTALKAIKEKNNYLSSYK